MSLRRPYTIDWPLVEALVAIPASVLDVAIALGISDTALRKAINTHRPDLVLTFAQAQATTRANAQTIDRRCERARQIAEVVAAHKAGGNYAER